jgi:hypothetical protein
MMEGLIYEEVAAIIFIATIMIIIMMKIESRSRGISYMKYVIERRTGLVTFYVETAFYNGLLKERYKGG